MVSLQIEEAKSAAKIDARDGLETIDLSDEKETERPQSSSMAAASVEAKDQDDMPEAFFRKTKSNNFFAIDTSSDKIEPMTET